MLLFIEQLPVGGCFLFQGEGVGAGGGGHAVEAERTKRFLRALRLVEMTRGSLRSVEMTRQIRDQIGDFYVDAAADGRDGGGVELGDDLGGFLASGHEGVAVGNLAEEGGDVRRGDDLEECVGGVVLQAADFAGGVVEGQAGFGAETADGGFVETFLAGEAEVVLVGKMDEAHYPPEVVDPVGIIERHAPPVLLRRKAPEEKDVRILRQEWLEGVFFCGYGHLYSFMQIKPHYVRLANPCAGIGGFFANDAGLSYIWEF